MSGPCKAYLPELDRWVPAYALKVFESGVVRVLMLPGDGRAFEADVRVWRVR